MSSRVPLIVEGQQDENSCVACINKYMGSYTVATALAISAARPLNLRAFGRRRKAAETWHFYDKRQIWLGLTSPISISKYSFSRAKDPQWGLQC